MEGFGEFAAILECLAERETEMKAIDGAYTFRRLGGPQPPQLLIGEAVGLEIREAPVRIAEIRPTRRRPAVGLDRLLAPSEGLQRMRDR